ncbi:transporter [Neosynechococcus sphagnicola sy1]|uniref:Transporter n=1 Tax=Neosynechococcus sphagnicola sy1 TaxID=1497020 RepID=A0A098TNL4_9CYAN|nr:AEC family transporter [Neosynechococcus sphagnicola]KGF72428.1 transporter [Neosynechococcus sphagnicola sy1]
MTDALLHAYTPLILWMGLGLILFRFIPQDFPRFLGRGLYWVGGPLQILALARRTDFAQGVGMAPLVTFAALGIGLGLAALCLFGFQQLAHYPAHPLASRFAWLGERSAQGSFLLAATLGNTGYVGLGLSPALIGTHHLGWSVSYSITHSLVGGYGIGVMLASRFSRPEQDNHWWLQLRDVLLAPSLWAFGCGIFTRTWELPTLIDSGLQLSLWLIIPSAFLLIGMRLSQLRGWSSFQPALLPATVRVLIVPILIGLGTTGVGLSGDPRLAVVLMAGMPTAFVGLVLAEEYNLDRQLVAGSIALTTMALLGTIPIWLLLFH